MAIFGKIRGDKQIQDRLDELEHKATKYLQSAVNLGAFSIERAAKTFLRAKVYSKPERGYKRTGTLRRSMHVAAPSASHSGDETRAKGGQELGGSEPKAAEEVSDGQIRAHVGTWLDYSEKVEKRTPYLQPAYEGAQDDVERYVEQALDALFDEVLP